MFFLLPSLIFFPSFFFLIFLVYFSYHTHTIHSLLSLWHVKMLSYSESQKYCIIIESDWPLNYNFNHNWKWNLNLIENCFIIYSILFSPRPKVTKTKEALYFWQHCSCESYREGYNLDLIGPQTCAKLIKKTNAMDVNYDNTVDLVGNKAIN